MAIDTATTLKLDSILALGQFFPDIWRGKISLVRISEAEKLIDLLAQVEASRIHLGNGHASSSSLCAVNFEIRYAWTVQLQS